MLTLEQTKKLTPGTSIWYKSDNAFYLYKVIHWPKFVDHGLFYVKLVKSDTELTKWEIYEGGAYDAVINDDNYQNFCLTVKAEAL